MILQHSFWMLGFVGLRHFFCKNCEKSLFLVRCRDGLKSVRGGCLDGMYWIEMLGFIGLRVLRGWRWWEMGWTTRIH